MSAPRYEIRTVADFLAVPPERLDTCLGEFATCLMMVHLGRAVEERTTLDRFTWIDDGERNVNAQVVMTHRDAPASPGSTPSAHPDKGE